MATSMGRLQSLLWPRFFALRNYLYHLGAFFDDSEPVHALVAEKDGELLGLAHYLFHRSTIQIKPVCYMQDLFTDEAARGQGWTCVD